MITKLTGKQSANFSGSASWLTNEGRSAILRATQEKGFIPPDAYNAFSLPNRKCTKEEISQYREIISVAVDAGSASTCCNLFSSVAQKYPHRSEVKEIFSPLKGLPVSYFRQFLPTDFLFWLATDYGYIDPPTVSEIMNHTYKSSLGRIILANICYGNDTAEDISLALDFVDKTGRHGYLISPNITRFLEESIPKKSDVISNLSDSAFWALFEILDRSGLGRLVENEASARKTRQIEAD